MAALVRRLPSLSRFVQNSSSTCESLALLGERCLLPKSTELLSDRNSFNYSHVRQSQFASGFSLPMPKTLNDIMRIETVEGLPPDEVARIWNDFHIGRGHISAVMATPLYEAFKSRAQACPLFVLPVRRDGGFVNMVTQAQIPYLLVTGLHDYKLRGTNAAPFFAVTHYTELAKSKGLVLVRGDVVLPSQLSDSEAQGLLKDVHAFYLQENKFRLVQAFNKDPRSFDFQAVLRESGVARS